MKLNDIKDAPWLDSLDKPIPNEEIIEVVKNTKNRKASGFDGITNEIIKASIPTTVHLLNKIFNHMLYSEKFPKTWSDGYIVNIYKKGDVFNPENYRGLTISSCIGKIFTKILSNRLVKYMLEKNLIQKSQIGFMPNCRTSDHVLVLKTICDLYKHKKREIISALSTWPRPLTL